MFFQLLTKLEQFDSGFFSGFPLIVAWAIKVKRAILCAPGSGEKEYLAFLCLKAGFSLLSFPGLSSLVGRFPPIKIRKGNLPG